MLGTSLNQDIISSMTTLNIKVQYVFLPVQIISNVSELWLNKHNDETMAVEQTVDIIRLIINQNCFQYSDKYFNPTIRIAVDRHISGVNAEIYIQFFEELTT